jgi:hypothetical protein
MVVPTSIANQMGQMRSCEESRRYLLTLKLPFNESGIPAVHKELSESVVHEELIGAFSQIKRWNVPASSLFRNHASSKGGSCATSVTRLATNSRGVAPWSDLGTTQSLFRGK